MEVHIVLAYKGMDNFIFVVSVSKCIDRVPELIHEYHCSGIGRLYGRNVHAKNSIIASRSAMRVLAMPGASPVPSRTAISMSNAVTSSTVFSSVFSNVCSPYFATAH
jgi:hypothetical protein